MWLILPDILPRPPKKRIFFSLYLQYKTVTIWKYSLVMKSNYYWVWGVLGICNESHICYIFFISICSVNIIYLTGSYSLWPTYVELCMFLNCKTPETFHFVQLEYISPLCLTQFWILLVSVSSCLKWKGPKTLSGAF